MNSVCVTETEKDARSSQILRDEHKTESIPNIRQLNQMCSQRPNILKATAPFLMCHCIYVTTFSSPVNPIITYHRNFTFCVICHQLLTTEVIAFARSFWFRSCSPDFLHLAQDSPVRLEPIVWWKGRKLTQFCQFPHRLQKTFNCPLHNFRA